MTRLMLTRVLLAAAAEEEEEEPLNRPEEDEGEMMIPEPRPTCNKAG
jgi:hypothetical protein